MSKDMLGSLVLKLINDNVSLGAIAVYDPKELKTRTGLWVSENFVAQRTLTTKSVENLGTLSLSSYQLMKRAYDREITPCLGGNYLFDESELCARIDQMVNLQSNGENGDLLNNGFANLFYVPGFVVRMHWDAVLRGWRVFTWEFGDYYWIAGNRLFVRN